MMILRAFLLALLLTPGFSWGNEGGLPPADELMFKASQGRIELREVLMDLENNIQEMGYPEVFDSYFYLLDGLKELAIRFNLDEIYPGAVENLGAQMVDSGIRWLDIAEAKEERLLYYHKWMNLDVAVRYMDQVEVEIGSLKNMDKVRSASDNVEILLNYVETRFPRYYHLKTGYRRILSNVALKFLRQPDISNEDVQHWIGKLRSPAGYMDYMILLSTEIYSLKEDTKGEAHVYSGRLKALATVVAQDGMDIPVAIPKGIGEISEDLILRFIHLEEPFQAEELRGLLDLLSVGQLHDLATRWNSFKKLPSDKYIQSYFESSREFVGKLREIGMAKEVADINSWVGAMGAPAMVRLLGMEGSYSLRDAQGAAWTLMIIKVREMQLEALMWKEGDEFGKLYQTIRWDFEKSTFVASERVLDLTDFSAPSLVKFNAIPGGIEFFNPFANPDTQKMAGVMTEAYEDLMKEATESFDYEGFYQGVLKDVAGKTIAVNLTVSSLGGHYMGRIIGEGVDHSFEMGSQVNGGALYLTASRDGSLSEFSHLRLRKNQGHLITPQGTFSLSAEIKH